MSAEQATAFKNQGNKAFQEGRFEEAVEAFTKAIEINPNDHVFYSNRSGAYASLDKLEEALQDANKCIEVKPDWAKGYQRKGHAQYELGNLEEAANTFKLGLSHEPGNAILKERLAKIEEEIKENESSSSAGQKGGLDNLAGQIMMKLAANPRTAEWLKDPSFMTKLQMLQKSPQMFSVLMQQDPRLGEAFNLLIGDFANMTGKGGAGTDFNFQAGSKSQEQKPEEPMEEEIHFEEPKKEEPKKEEPKKEAPKKEVPKQQKADPKLPEHESLKNQGNEFYTQKNFNRAIELYNQAIELEPHEVLYYNNKAAAYIELKDLNSALEAVETALKIAEEHNIKNFQKIAKIYARKASILSKKGELQSSLEWYQKTLLEDTNPNVKAEMKQVEKIKKDLDTKSYINPEIAVEHNEKAKVLFTEGKFPLALVEYNEAIKRSPNDAKYFTNRGICYIKLMEFHQGLKDLEKALEIDPVNVKAMTKKGNCHFALKEYHKALSTYEKGLQLAPDNQELKDLILKTRTAAYMGGNKEEQEERAKQAMQDPEIQKILRTPEIQNALKELQGPNANAQKILNDPSLAPQIAKLVEAGILRLG